MCRARPFINIIRPPLIIKLFKICIVITPTVYPTVLSCLYIRLKTATVTMFGNLDNKLTIIKTWSYTVRFVKV